MKAGSFIEWIKVTVSGFVKNNCTMHAAGLTYFSMLALVPILCILILAAKTCNVDDLVRRHVDVMIDRMITNIESSQDDELAAVTAPDEATLEARREVAMQLGAQAREMTNALFERIDKFDVGTLGWIGFGFLLWTVISSIGMVEISFNEIWRVPKPRAIWHRAWLYLGVVIVLPVIGALAMSIPLLNMAKNIIISTLGATWLTEWVSTGLIWFLDSWIFSAGITLLFASLDFAFLFSALPNCKVDFKYAWRGGIITAILFATWMKVCAVAQVGVAKSSALYGSLAFLPIILAWLYMSWQIVLLGANMTYAFHAVDGSGAGGARRKGFLK